MKLVLELKDKDQILSENKAVEGRTKVPFLEGNLENGPSSEQSEMKTTKPQVSLMIAAHLPQNNATS